MPYDPNDEETKAAFAEMAREKTEKLEAKVRELIGEKRRQGEGKVDAVELERIEAERDALKADLTKAQRDLKTASTAAETAAKALATEQAAAHKLLIENGLSAALTEAGVTDPNYAKAAAALIEKASKLEVVADGDKRSVQVGGKALADHVKEWGLSPEGKAFVSAPNNSGGGAAGSDGKGGAVNPWAKDSFDLTAQGKLYKENPTQAKAQAAQHGVVLE